HHVAGHHRRTRAGRLRRRRAAACLGRVRRAWRARRRRARAGRSRAPGGRACVHGPVRAGPGPRSRRARRGRGDAVRLVGRRGARRRPQRAGLGGRRGHHQLRDRHPPGRARATGVRVRRRRAPVSDAVVQTESDLPDAATTRALGAALAAVLRAGDLVILTGDLGAGKTTLTQGLGAALGVRGQVASPTFIVAREHPSLVGGPALVHVDAYRLGSLDEVDALDLDSSLEESVTVVEWGSGLVEALAGDRLEIVLERPRGADDAGGDADDDAPEAGERRVTVRGVGARWADLDVAALAG